MLGLLLLDLEYRMMGNSVSRVYHRAYYREMCPLYLTKIQQTQLPLSEHPIYFLTLWQYPLRNSVVFSCYRPIQNYKLCIYICSKLTSPFFIMLALNEDINFNLQHLQRHLGQQQILLLGGLNDGLKNLGSYQKQAGVVELQTLQIDYEIY